MSIEAITFTDEERKALLDDYAYIYLPVGETIKGQKSARRPFLYVVDGCNTNGRNRLTEYPSRRIEVAIYPDHKRLFVSNSFNKTTDQQIALVEQDAQSLRKRLRQPNIGEILPEASEATEILFKYFDATNIRILDEKYMYDGYRSHIRTSTPTNLVGSDVAHVGDLGVDFGLLVDDWDRDRASVSIGAARWIVPQGPR